MPLCPGPFGVGGVGVVWPGGAWGSAPPPPPLPPLGTASCEASPAWEGRQGQQHL